MESDNENPITSKVNTKKFTSGEKTVVCLILLFLIIGFSVKNALRVPDISKIDLSMPDEEVLEKSLSYIDNYIMQNYNNLFDESKSEEYYDSVFFTCSAMIHDLSTRIYNAEISRLEKMNYEYNISRPVPEPSILKNLGKEYQKRFNTNINLQAVKDYTSLFDRLYEKGIDSIYELVFIMPSFSNEILEKTRNWVIYFYTETETFPEISENTVLHIIDEKELLNGTYASYLKETVLLSLYLINNDLALTLFLDDIIDSFILYPTSNVTYRNALRKERKRQEEIEQKRQAELEAEKKRQEEIRQEQLRQEKLRQEQERQAQLERERLERQRQMEEDNKRTLDLYQDMLNDLQNTMNQVQNLYNFW